MAKNKKEIKLKEDVRKPTQALAIAAFILNIFILPGLGSMIAGDNRTGLKQMILLLIGVLLTITIISAIIGIPVIISAWAWSLVTAVKIVKKA